MDLKPLKESILQEVYPIPDMNHTIAHLAGVQQFSKLDANSADFGFWQIPLAAESRALTTFLTPFGSYCFNKLPLGISSVPEEDGQILEGLKEVLHHMYDVLVFSTNSEEHDRCLVAVLKWLEAVGVTLNANKCAFNKDREIPRPHCGEYKQTRTRQ